MLDKKKLDKIMSQVKGKIQDFQLEFGQNLEEHITSKFQAEWDLYKQLIDVSTDKEKEELLDPKSGFGITSLDKIVVEATTKFKDGVYKSTISVNRPKDARILEYVYGKRSPMANILLRYHNKTTIKSILKDTLKKS